MTPREIAGYELGPLLGAGGMGEVHLARHPRLPREVVIKLMTAGGRDDQEARERFLREADLAARLDHPNIVTVFDRGEADGLLWISMQYVAGHDASQLCEQQGPLDPARVLGWADQVAAALDHAHSRGVIHRDVKPANILIAATPTGERALIGDFGIARSIEPGSDLTSTSSMVGSVAYASAEQLRGERVGPQADVYSLAATLFHLLSGVKPFPGATASAVLAAALTAPRPSLARMRPGVPPAVDQVFARGLSLRPDDRYPSAGALAHALRLAWSTAPTAAASTVDQSQEPTISQASFAGAVEPADRAVGHRSRVSLLVGAGVVAVALGAAAAYAFSGRGSDGPGGAVSAAGSQTAASLVAGATSPTATNTGPSVSTPPNTSAPNTGTATAPGVAPTTPTPTSTAGAVARNGVCDPGEFCLQYNSAKYGFGSTSDFDSSVPNYGTKLPACETYLGPGSGNGQCIKNNAAAYWNRSDRTVRIYFNSGFTGRFLDVPPGARGDLPAWLKNNDASHQFL